MTGCKPSGEPGIVREFSKAFKKSGNVREFRQTSGDFNLSQQIFSLRLSLHFRTEILASWSERQGFESILLPTKSHCFDLDSLRNSRGKPGIIREFHSIDRFP